jgi:hypothetical protein
MTNKIFDLEQSIMKCWAIVEDIETVYNNEEAYKDQDLMMNALLGLMSIYNMKFEELFKLFEQITKEYWEMKRSKAL